MRVNILIQVTRKLDKSKRETEIFLKTKKFSKVEVKSKGKITKAKKKIMKREKTQRELNPSVIIPEKDENKS